MKYRFKYSHICSNTGRYCNYSITLLFQYRIHFEQRLQIFRNLLDNRPVLAHLLSMAAFSLIHVAGYVGRCDALQLLLCFVQYLPAGYCLCFVYRRSGTILSPILVHAIVNALGVYNTLR